MPVKCSALWRRALRESLRGTDSNGEDDRCAWVGRGASTRLASRVRGHRRCWVLAAMSVVQNEERWAEIIEIRGEQIRVAIVDGRVVGFASSGPYRVASGDDKTLNTTVFAEPGSIGELYGFYVHPDSWGTGVANELHDRAVDALRADGWVRLKLWVLADNARARRFYERHGWTADGASETLSIPGAPIEVRYEMVDVG